MRVHLGGGGGHCFEVQGTGGGSPRTGGREKPLAGYVQVFQAELPDKDIQRMINIWNPYNCSISFNRKKSMTAFTTGMEKGGVQSRDSSQDSMAADLPAPDLARERLLLIYRYQMPSGEFYSTFDPDAGKPADYYAVRSDNGSGRSSPPTPMSPRRAI